MLAKDERAGATPDAQGAARPSAAGKTSRSQSLASGGGDAGAPPVGYLAGDGPDVVNLDSDVELRSILARLEFMGTFVDVGVDRAEVMEELASLRARIDALEPTLTPAQHERVVTRLRATEDVVLAGMQERVLAGAEREEQAGVDDDDPAGRVKVIDYTQTIGWGSDVSEHAGEVVYSSGGNLHEFQWCGAFAGHNYVESGGFDPELARSFSSAPSMVNFFTYDWGRRNPRYIQIDGAWIDVRDYHADRGSERRWWSAGDIAGLVASGGFAALPIRPGDIVIIDNDNPEADGPADHVAMVQSWDGAGMLVTIDGNARRLDGSGDETVEDGILRDDELQRTLSGHGPRIHGIGRPSIVDLEVHTYVDHLPEP